MTRLSADHGAFFESHHHSIAEDVAERAAQLAELADARSMAEAMGGEHDLYRFLAAEDGVDLRAVCLVREALAYHSPLADSIYAVHGLGSYPIVLAGTVGQRQRYLGDCRRGVRIAAFALTEPGAGSDVASLETSARREGDEFVLDGTKTFISNVGIADHFIVFAKTDPEAGSRGISAFIVEQGAPGLSAVPFSVGYDHPIGELTLRACRVPAAQLLGEVGEGFKLAMRTLDTFRVSVGAAAVGMAARAVDEAILHVRSRAQFGKPLSAQPVVRSYLADMATELEASRLLVYRAAQRRDSGADVTTLAAMAKLYSTEAAQRIIDRAVQLFGGRGVKSGEVVEGLYRAIRPLRIYEGTSEIQRLIIGRALVQEGV